MAEVWALKPSLQLVLLERVAATSSAPGTGLPVLLGSLRTVGECQWKELFESVSIVHRELSRDPVDAYSRMDYESRENYRLVIAELSKHSARTEHQVAEAAVQLAAETTGHERQKHVGFWLIDKGLDTLGAGDRLPSSVPPALVRCGPELAPVVLLDRY